MKPIVFLARRLPPEVEREMAERFELCIDDGDRPLDAHALGEAMRVADALVPTVTDRIDAAGLDVFEREPEVLPALLALDDVVLLPHIGSATRETRSAMGRLVLANLIAFFEGREPPNRVA